MNIFNRNRMALSLALVLAVGTAWAHSADPALDGWVGRVHGRQLRICYQHAPPPVGMPLRILKTSYITPNKGLARARYVLGGKATVAGIDDARCVSAELTAGTAHRGDHARGDH